MNSLQDSVKIPLMQNHEYPVEKHDSSQEDEPFQLSNSSNNRKRFAGRVVFALFAVVAGALVASKLFGPHGHQPPPFPPHHTPRIFDCKDLEVGDAFNLTFSTHPGKNFFLHPSLSAASVHIERDSSVAKNEILHFDQEHHNKKMEHRGGEKKGPGHVHAPPPPAIVLVEISRSSGKETVEGFEIEKESKKERIQACTVDAGDGVGLGIFPVHSPPKEPKDPKDVKESHSHPDPTNFHDALSEISLKISLPSNLPPIPLVFGMSGPPPHPHGPHHHPHPHGPRPHGPHGEKPCNKSMWSKIKKALGIKGGKKYGHGNPKNHHHRQHRQETQA